MGIDAGGLQVSVPERRRYECDGGTIVDRVRSVRVPCGGIDAGALGGLLDDVKLTARSLSGLPGRRTDGNTAADAGASPRLANRRVAITAGISTSRLLLPLPTIEICASPLSRRMT